MKQSRIERRRFLKELWYTLIRWVMLFFIVGSMLLTALIIYLKTPFTALPYLIVFFIALTIVWLAIFFRKQERKDFSGDV